MTSRPHIFGRGRDDRSTEPSHRTRAGVFPGRGVGCVLYQGGRVPRAVLGGGRERKQCSLVRRPRVRECYSPLRSTVGRTPRCLPNIVNSSSTPEGLVRSRLCTSRCREAGLPLMRHAQCKGQAPSHSAVATSIWRRTNSTTACRAKARISGQLYRCAFDGKGHEDECNRRSAVLHVEDGRSASTACCALSVRTAWPAALRSAAIAATRRG